MKRRKPAPELPRIYVRPTLERRQREACRAFVAATCSGERHRPKPGTVDPLWLRLGLRARLVQARAGWVVSNPLYSDTLDRHPHFDPSLPGPGWLQEVYRYRDGRELCVLPWTRAAISVRLERLRQAEDLQRMGGGGPIEAAPVEPQLELFA